MIYFVVLIVSMVATTMMIKRYSIVDHPNERSAHTTPIPTGGGIAIVISFYMGLIFFYFNGVVEDNLFYALLSGLLLVVVSFIDDMIELSPTFRIIVQLTSVIGVLYFLDIFSSFAWHEALFFILSSLWLINLYNFLDGIDGYAGSEGIVASLGGFMIYQNSLFIIMAVSISGFLLFNWQKASIFMGDVGSIFLGFFFVVMALYNYHSFNDIINWYILLGVFIFDATITLYRRAKRGEKLSLAHKKHAFQRLVQSGFSHQKVVIYAMGINIISIFILFLLDKSNYLIFFFVCYNIFMFILLKIIDTRRAF